MKTIDQHSSLTRTFDDQRYAWTRTRRLRRRLVAAEAMLLGALTLVVLVASITTEEPHTTALLMVAVGLLVFVPLHSLLNLGIRGLFDRGRATLDEHQRRIRERSASATWTANAALTLAAWLGGVAVVSATGHTTLSLFLGFLLWLAAGLLTYWHLAWTLPDETLETEA